MQILDFPCELLLLIVENLSVKDLSHFLRACRHLSFLLTPHFHKLALQDVGTYTALQWASTRGHASLAELVLSKGAGGGLGSGGCRRFLLTPLHLAAVRNHPDVIRILANHGEPINARDFSLSTPLHGAASQRSVHAIRVLLELGAEMSKDQWGRTPAHISATMGDIDSMRAFIDAGWDIYHGGEMGRTVLHEAMFRGKGMVEFLLGHGGERIINAQDSSGKTPLHWAVSGHTADEGIARLLCCHGADKTVKNYLGETPVDLAIRSGQDSLARVMLGCMANVSDRE